MSGQPALATRAGASACQARPRQWIVPLVLLVDDAAPGAVVLQEATDDGQLLARVTVQARDLPAAVAEREATRPRWVWDDTSRRYPALLAAGVRVERCHDLRLCHAILRGSALCADSALATAPPRPWDAARAEPLPVAPSLSDDEPATVDDHLDVPEELARQLAAVAGSTAPGRLRLLLAAESTGALIAAEIRHDGLPWSVQAHDELLTRLLGERPRDGRRPAKLEALAEQVRTLLGQPDVNLDSQPDLLHALHLAGLDVSSTRVSEIRVLDNPVVAPLLEYKKLARLLSANGWSWMETWVADGRFRPDYVPGGVVTGRWATSGGGALQLPAAVRGAVRADPGWRLVVADAAQLEPRVLAAMSGDGAMPASTTPWYRSAWRPVPGRGRRRHRADPQAGQGRDARCDLRRDDGCQRGADAAADQGVPARRRDGRGCGPCGGAGRGRLDLARPLLTAAGRGVAGGGRGGVERGGRPRGRPGGAQPQAGLGPVHAQLHRAGHGSGVGAVLDGRAASSAARHRGAPAPGLLPARRGHGALACCRGRRRRGGRSGGCGRGGPAAVRGLPGGLRAGSVGGRLLRPGEVVPDCNGYGACHDVAHEHSPGALSLGRPPSRPWRPSACPGGGRGCRLGPGGGCGSARPTGNR